MNQVVSLHSVQALQKIPVRDTISLRPLKSSDAQQFLNILDADQSIRKKVTVASHFHTVEDVASQVDKYKADPGLIRYTVLRDNTPIGLISLWRDDGFFGTPSQLNNYGFGYFLDPKERGKGIVTSALKSVMETVQKHLYVEQFVAFCEDYNAESISVLSKLGFERTEETFSEPEHGWVERKYIKHIDSI
ncbi:MAG: GNAT family N-acetyltransferase [Microgenomates group bacterium]